MYKNRKEDKRNEAKQRQAARDLRTPQEQLDKLDKDNWAATKEKIRLRKQIEIQKEKLKKETSFPRQ